MPNVHLQVIRIQRFSIHDGPGIRTTVFLKGCPMRCLWCHNPESQLMNPVMMYNPRLCRSCNVCVPVCPSHAQQVDERGHHIFDHQACTACGACLSVCMYNAMSLHGKVMEMTDVVSELLKDRDYYAGSGGGITLSGGEPLMQPEVVLQLAQWCEDNGISLYVDTCGYIDSDSFAQCISKVHGVLYDLKIIDEKKHRVWTGVSNLQILENFRIVCQMNVDTRIRSIVVPGVNDSSEDVEALADFALSCGYSGIIDLMPLHHWAAGKYACMGKSYPMEGVDIPTSENLERIIHTYASKGLQAVVR
jgi:pyruvate formate lyase activating enzyme